MNTLIARTLVLLSIAGTALHAQDSQLINYQGRVAVNGVNFDGSGQFKFAIVNSGGTTSYWSNDGTGTAGSEPAAAVALKVTGGLYSVLLGDTSLPNMAAIPAGVLTNSAAFLRVWFNDGNNGSKLLTPDQRLQMDCTTTTADAWQQRIMGTPPVARNRHTAVWTGSEMIVWGGFQGNNDLSPTGGSYNPSTNSWTEMSLDGVPKGRFGHTAVWTGSEMIVWGGTDNYRSLNDGASYNPLTNSWTGMSLNGAPSPRQWHTAVWTGSEMIIWGGSYVSGNSNNGGRYNPAEQSWSVMSNTGAPSARNQHTAVWTGSEMIVWGGYNGGMTGGRYDPVGDSWTAVSPTNAPPARVAATAVWTGSEMIVWGGTDNSGRVYLNDGGRYNPTGNTWETVNVTGAPAGRNFHTAVWTGNEMIVWGGDLQDPQPPSNSGGRFNPAENIWTVMSTTGAPNARSQHTAVWTGSEMLVWGGNNRKISGSYFNDTFSYTPKCEPFRILSADLGSGNLTLSFPTVTGRTYTLWRSDTLTSGTWTNTGLTALAGTGATLTFTVPATTPAGRFFRVQGDP